MERSLDAGASLSGSERNHAFLNLGGDRFLDLSGISGADHVGDGRSVARLDFDRDGAVDLAVTGANAPRLQLFHNRHRSLLRLGQRSNFLAVGLVGGNASPRPRPGFAPRDGIGARLEVALEAAEGASETRLFREFRAGEGLAAQNSATLLVGLGPRDGARELAVRWPSGRVQHSGPVAAGSRVTVYEDPAHSPTGNAFLVEPYGPTARFREPEESPAAGPLRLFTTMASWCQACRGELPHLRRLAQAFPPGRLELVGVPADPGDWQPGNREDGGAKLRAFAEEADPPYRLIDGEGELAAWIRSLVVRDLGREGFPAAVIVDARGVVREVSWGTPTLSRLRILATDPP